MNLRGVVGMSAVLMLLSAPPVGAGAPHVWETYRNGRFGYSVLYPSDLLRPLPESDNGDGRRFQPVEGHAEVAVWAGYANGETLAALAGRTEADCAGGHASYKAERTAKRTPFVALSCLKPDGAVFYVKAVQCHDVVSQIQFTYPATERATWDPVVAKMSASFGAGCGFDG